ncbi:hypothetical protein HKD37_07G019652 [Glycine soja]
MYVDDNVLVTIKFHPQQWCMEFHCFSLRTNSWSCIGTILYYLIRHRHKLFLNGVLHRLVESHIDCHFIIICEPYVLSLNGDLVLLIFFPICSTKNSDILGSNGNTLVRLNHKGKLLKHQQLGEQEMVKFGYFTVVHTERVFYHSLREFEKST